MAGDKILVNKLLYGARLPTSPYDIPWFNVLYHFKRSYAKNSPIVNWKYRRLKGFSNCKKNDIVVFNLPNEDKILIKRCIALPGDTLLIDRSIIYINRNKQDYPNSIKLRYEIYPILTLSLQELFADIAFHNCTNETQIGRNRNCTDLDNNELHRLNKVSGIDSIKRYYEFNPIMVERSVGNIELNWSVDNYGPLIIPKKGTKIKLNHENYVKYKKTIKFGENLDMTFRNDSFFIDDRYKEYYTFQSNYYFLMGDNRYNSMDSRYIGMIPEELLIGQTRRILFSNTNGRLFWKRLFKRIK